MRSTLRIVSVKALLTASIQQHTACEHSWSHQDHKRHLSGIPQKFNTSQMVDNRGVATWDLSEEFSRQFNALALKNMPGRSGLGSSSLSIAQVGRMPIAHMKTRHLCDAQIHVIRVLSISCIANDTDSCDTWFDVTVQDALAVHVLQRRQHLLPKEAHGPPVGSRMPDQVVQAAFRIMPTQRAASLQFPARNP